MSEGAIEPTAVYQRRDIQASTGRQRFYETYNTRDVPIGGDESAPAARGPAVRVYNIGVRLPGGSQPAPTPRYVPSFLGSRSVIMFSWGVAMILVSLDEWKTHHILPRPMRLWDTSLTFMLLAGASTLDVLTPLCSAMAIGLVVALLMNYYSGGITPFGGFGSAPASGGNGNAPLNSQKIANTAKNAVG